MSKLRILGDVVAMVGRVDRLARVIARGNWELADQPRRASISVGLNAAEGMHARGKKRVHARRLSLRLAQLDIAMGSGRESIMALRLAGALGLLEPPPSPPRPTTSTTSTTSITSITSWPPSASSPTAPGDAIASGSPGRASPPCARARCSARRHPLGDVAHHRIGGPLPLIAEPRPPSRKPSPTKPAVHGHGESVDVEGLVGELLPAGLAFGAGCGASASALGGAKFALAELGARQRRWEARSSWWANSRPANGPAGSGLAR
ncbi:MAG TPA: four helix bundle protein, partial [Polyangiaceae bacterium]|nr:four helix bundle protein [Polyangiaceae bacterium]